MFTPKNTISWWFVPPVWKRMIFKLVLILPNISGWKLQESLTPPTCNDSFIFQRSSFYQPQQCTIVWEILANLPIQFLASSWNNPDWSEKNWKVARPGYFTLLMGYFTPFITGFWAHLVTKLPSLITRNWTIPSHFCCKIFEKPYRARQFPPNKSLPINLGNLL